MSAGLVKRLSLIQVSGPREAMAKQINFEVQVMQGGRWTISARFPSTGQELAIEEAKQIDASGIGEVRVLRDVYDSETGMSTEFTVYKSGGASGTSSGGGGGHSGGGGDSWDDDDDDDFGGGSDDDWMSGSDDDDYDDDYGDDYDDDRPARKKSKKGKGGKQTGFTGLLVKLLFAILLALGLSATVVAVMSPYIEGINFFGMRLTGVAKENALIMTFLVTFLATSIMLATVLLKNTSLKAKKKKLRHQRASARNATARPTAKQGQQASPPPPPQSGDASDASQLTPMEETGSMEQFREEAADGTAQAAEAPTSTTEEEESAKRGVVLDAEDMPMMGENGEVGLSPHAEKQKTYMMGFIDKAMGAIGKDKKSMSNFDKFGVSLFLAGACESLGQTQEIDEGALAKIMADSVQTMGFKRSHAKTFADKYEEYLVQDPTYMQMFQAGRNAMATYSTDESRIAQNTQAAMTEWNKPKVKEAEAGPVTVLFTDIAGSTAMTQNLGDAGAQQVVRAHNRVVREALTMWNGKEVKHTGDGIMASFVKTSDSLDAAMQMQREANEYTSQNPDKPLKLKIGINAGEPISEDNDLFGSTVQMSARIVDKAQADEIFVSEIVRGICAGKSYKFKSRGTYPMKGFDVDPVLYEVVWAE